MAPNPSQAVVSNAPTRTWSTAEVAAFMGELRREVRALGVFKGERQSYVLRSLWVVGVTIVAWAGLLHADAWPLRVFFALLAGYAGVQAAAIGHEAAHGAVSRHRGWTFFVGQCFMTGLMGMPFSAWVDRHGKHHIHPNSSKDPDVRPGLFSFNAEAARSATGAASWFTRHQHLLLFPLSVLMSLSLKLNGWVFVSRHLAATRVDVGVLLLYATAWWVLPVLWLGWVDAGINYLLVLVAEGAYLAFVFLPNHLGEPTGDESQDWPPALRQIVTARNLSGGWWMTHLCVGLNTHIEHHLFGHMPTNRLPESRAITKRMCAAHGIPYREYTLAKAFAQVHRYNRRMAQIANDAARARRMVSATSR